MSAKIIINSFGHIVVAKVDYDRMKEANPVGLAWLTRAEVVFAHAGLEACVSEMLSGNGEARAAFVAAVSSYRPHNFRVALNELAALTAPHRREALAALAATRGSDFSNFFRTTGAAEVINIIRRSDGWTTGHRPGDTALVSVAQIALVLGWRSAPAEPKAEPAPAAPAAEPAAAPAVEPTAAPKAPAAAEQTAAPAAEQTAVPAAPKAPAETPQRRRVPRSAKR